MNSQSVDSSPPLPAPGEEAGEAHASHPVAREPLPAADGGLVIVGIGDEAARIVGAVKTSAAVRVLRIQTSGSGPELFPLTLPATQEAIEQAPFLEELGLKAETFNLELRCCAKALYLFHRTALLTRLREQLAAEPFGSLAIVAEAATGVGSVFLSELAIDLEALFARRAGRSPCLLRIPLFPASSGGELERTTLYALARDLDAHAGGPHEDDEVPPCENPHDGLVLSDFQVGTPAQRREELGRFLGALAATFRSSAGLAARDNPLARQRFVGPWRRSYRDLTAIWRDGGWTDFHRRRVVKELAAEGPPPPLVDQEPFRAGRRLYQELDVRHRRLLAAAPYDYPGRISPDDSGSLAELGDQLLEDGRDRDAFDAFEAAAQARADWPVPLEGMGRAAMLLGDLDEAMRDFTRAIQLDPESDGAHEGILLCYLSAGRTEMARSHYKLAVSAGRRIAADLARRLD